MEAELTALDTATIEAECVTPGHTGLFTWHTFPSIWDGTWPIPYICCNYL
jgi:hypothetical protein